MRRGKQVRVFVFGNSIVAEDRAAIEVARKLEGKIAGVEFVFCSSYDELALAGDGKVIVMDAVEGMREPKILKISDLEASHPYSAHDLDLGFFLKLMKPKNVRIVGVPKTKKKIGAGTVGKTRKLLLQLIR